MGRKRLLNDEALFRWLEVVGSRSAAAIRHQFGVGPRPVWNALESLRDGHRVYVAGFEPPLVQGKWAALYAVRVTGREVDAQRPAPIGKPRRDPLAPPKARVARVVSTADGVKRSTIERVKPAKPDHTRLARERINLGPWAGL